jgi:hypothetical protein
MAEGLGEAMDRPARQPRLTRDPDIEALHRTIRELRTQVTTAVDAARRAEETAHQADQRADDAFRHVQYSALALGLSFGMALVLIILAVIPGGQL